MKNIEFLADPTVGEVRIGCTPWLAASFGAAVIERLARLYPRIMFHLVTGYAEGLHDGLCDRNRPVDRMEIGPIVDERLRFEFLFDDRCVVVTSSQSPWARGEVLSAELVNEPWVLPPPGSGMTSIAMKPSPRAGSLILTRPSSPTPPRSG